MNTYALPPLLPRDKHDTHAAAALVALGWDRVECVAPQMLEWMQDSNWPVAAVLRPFLLAQGARLAPYIKPIFATADDVWKYFILAGIVRPSPELASVLGAELARMASHPTAGERLEGVAAQARDILAADSGRQHHPAAGIELN